MQVTKVAGTPSPFPPVLEPEAASQLELDTVLELVAAHAVSPLGAAAVRARRPSPHLDTVRSELADVGEMMWAVGRADAFEPRIVPDLAPTLDALAVPGSVLEAEALVTLGQAIASIRDVAAQLVRRVEDAPRLARYAVDPPPAALGAAIERSFEADGQLRDDASPGLRRARRRTRECRERLVDMLERIARDQGAGDRGEAVTIRDGRYVIPVRRDVRGGVRGIVHGESSSGATLFVEPEGAVELGNELRAAESEEAREELRVLRALTEEVRPWAAALAAGAEMCIATDDLYARARYAIGVRAAVPTVSAPSDGIAVRMGYHPILCAEGGVPVPFDLTLAADESTVLVSGPNAGGKTVLLKSIGLASAMAQSGMVPPVGKGTRLAVFRRIHTDIGDRQSIDQNLSTFSAHVTALRDIVSDATGDCLVLLDEVGGGTDPIEGAALAGGVLLALTDRGAVTVATTHLTPLKELAARTAGMVNASFEFDSETLAPTYRFQQGKPGRSYGIAIARRLGLASDVLARADALMPDEARTLEATLAELERREGALAEREARAEADRVKLERASADSNRDREALESARAELAERERVAEREGRERARRFLLDARRRVEEALGIARAAVSEATAKEARRLVEEGVREEADAIKQLEAAAQAQGWKVTRKVDGRDGNDAHDGSEHRGATTASQVVVPPSTSSSIDLRGLRAADAESQLRLLIDEAVVAELPYLRIIHGKGTGALRAAVADVLRGDERVRAFHHAAPDQGGTGVTIAELTP